MKKQDNVLWLLFRALWLPGVIFLVNLLLDSLSQIYVRYPWLDIPMHLIGGAAIGYTGFVFLRYLKKVPYIHTFTWLMDFAMIIMWAAFIAVWWEGYELFLDTFLGRYTQPSVRDTVSDLYLGMIGAGISAVALISRGKTKITKCV